MAGHTQGRLTVMYDGPSRAIIATQSPDLMLTLGRLEGGSAHTYPAEDADTAELVRRWNAFEEGGAARDAAQALRDLLEACVAKSGADDEYTREPGWDAIVRARFWYARLVDAGLVGPGQEGEPQ